MTEASSVRERPPIRYAGYEPPEPQARLKKRKIKPPSMDQHRRLVARVGTLETLLTQIVRDQRKMRPVVSEPAFVRSPNFTGLGQRRPSIDEIKRLVCATYNVTSAELHSRVRTSTFVWPRQVAVYLALRLLDGISLTQVGRHFGDFDHTTILHARKKLAALRLAEPAVDAKLLLLEEQLTS